MIAAAVVFVYLALVLYVGIFAFRRAGKGGGKAEDFFLANRSLGTFVFLLSLFGSNMTSFAILGSSGLAFRSGIMVYGLMASISGIVIPLSIFVIGTRIWAIGKRFGHMTQVQIFRDRWEMGHIGTVIFLLQALMLLPYIIIGVMGGGETLEGVSNGAVPYWFGGLIVALVVMGYVFFGGMRGTAWVNTLQTLMFLVFGTIAFAVIAHGIGGFGSTVQRMADTLTAKPAPTTLSAATQATSARSTTAPTTQAVAPPLKPQAAPPPPDGAALIRGKVNPSNPTAIDRVAKGYWFSYAFIPLSSIMFPHIAIFCLTAKRMASFRKTVIFYPLCIMAIWLPAVFLGTIASSQTDLVADLAVKSESFAQFKEKNLAGAKLMEEVAAGTIKLSDPRATPLKAGPLKGEMRRLANSNSDGVMLAMLNRYAPAILAGILGAAIMACVMATDSQILALSTMWAEDVYRFYGGKSETAQVWSARIFVVVCTIVAYAIALSVHEYANIFELAIQYAFSGYASLAPIMLACLFWRRSTKWGALASALWVALALIFITWIQWQTVSIAPANPALPPVRIEGWELFGQPLFFREFNRVSFTSARFLMVFPMFIGAVVFMWLGSILTSPPSRETIAKYFPSRAAVTAAAFALALMMIGVSDSRADDWPRWRGPGGDGICHEKGLMQTWPQTFRPVWSAEVGQGFSSPVACKGCVYLFSVVNGKDTLTSYDAQTGRVIWSESYNNGWTGSYPGTRATPYIEDNRIYTYGGAGDLAARDLATGKGIWGFNVLKELKAQPLPWAQASNLLIDGDLIYLQSGAGGPVAVAIDKNTGKIIWRSQARKTGSYAHPVLAEIKGTRQLIVYAADGPIGINPADGKTIWHIPWQNDPGVNASDPICRDGYLFFTSAYDRGSMMVQLLPDRAKKVWENKEITSRFQPAMLDGEALYVNSEGTLKCLKWPTNKLLWTMPNEDRNLLGMGGSMVRINEDELILVSQSGRLSLVKATPQGYRRISSVPDIVEGGEVWATPAIHDGRLYARGERELVCIDIKSR